jgi:hypothetical protein
VVSFVAICVTIGWALFISEGLRGLDHRKLMFVDDEDDLFI